MTELRQVPDEECILHRNGQLLLRAHPSQRIRVGRAIPRCLVLNYVVAGPRGAREAQKQICLELQDRGGPYSKWIDDYAVGMKFSEIEATKRGSILILTTSW